MLEGQFETKSSYDVIENQISQKYKKNIENHLSPCFENLVDHQIDILLLVANLNGNLILILTSYLVTKHIRSSWFGTLDQLLRTSIRSPERLVIYLIMVDAFTFINLKLNDKQSHIMILDTICYFSETVRATTATIRKGRDSMNRKALWPIIMVLQATFTTIIIITRYTNKRLFF